MTNLDVTCASPLLHGAAQHSTASFIGLHTVLSLLMGISFIALLNHRPMPCISVWREWLLIIVERIASMYVTPRKTATLAPIAAYAWLKPSFVLDGHQLELPTLGTRRVALPPSLPWGRRYVRGCCKSGTLTTDGLESVTTSFGVKMPRLIYRSWEPVEHLERAAKAGFWGFDIVYPALDVGLALASIFSSGFAREQLYIQVKIYSACFSEMNPDLPISRQVELTIANVLSQLRLEYIDCLILSPYPKHDWTMEAWRAVEEAVRTGLVRQLGISNIESLDQLRAVYTDATSKPAVVQQPFHAETAFEEEMRVWCLESGLQFQALRTLSGTNKRILSSKQLAVLAKKYRVTAKVIFLRFVMSLGLVPLTSTLSDTDMKGYLSASSVPLQARDAEKINDLLQFAVKVANAGRNYYYIMFHKPPDCITSRVQNMQGAKTVFTYLRERGLPDRVFDVVQPVGRLDKRSEGILLLTNDFVLEYALRNSFEREGPSKKQVQKVYQVQVANAVEHGVGSGNLTQGQLRQLQLPIEIDGKMTEPAQVRAIEPPLGDPSPNSTWLEVIINEGRNLQIRRLCNRSSLSVLRLRRVMFGPLQLPQALRYGEWRPLSQQEVDDCYKSADLAIHEKAIALDIPNETQTFDELLEGIRGEICELQERRDYKQYQRLILETFRRQFAECKKASKTTLSRTEYKERYGSMHATDVWSKVCENYFGSTKDPLRKSDEFLEMMSKLHHLWQAGCATQLK